MLLQHCDHVLRVVPEHSLGNGCLLLFKAEKRLRNHEEKLNHPGCFHHERHYRNLDDNVLEVPHQTGPQQQDHD